MPNLEPAIVESIRWQETIKQRDHHTLPIGPIRWQYDDNGNLVATAIGKDNDKPRLRVLGSLDVQQNGGVARLALSPGRNQLATANHASTAQTPFRQETPLPAKTMQSSDADLNVGKSPNSSVQDSSRAGTYTVPYQDVREGTSASKYEQQQGTHAQGQVADGTPAVKLDGQGERQALSKLNLL
jgi:hypothetical protein